MKRQYFIAMCIVLVLFFKVELALADRAEAEILGTGMGSPLTGMAYMQEMNNGLDITISVANAKPGFHGIHIHEFGSCHKKGLAAGGHYNPMGAEHGFTPRQGVTMAHAGDLGNIQVQPSGQGVLKLFVPGISITHGKFNVAGRAVILHEKMDDFAQPLGNAGGRIGCGTIAIANNAAI
ncbi:MAG: Cu-Zn family superoxide dismutase [Candidatus Omnitrophota bacterium]|jgi:Cu-Zn family superoxide dismutase